MSSKIIATKLISECGDIKNLKDLNYYELSKFKGIGPAKACNILAAIELGKRINQEVITLNRLQVTNSTIIFNYYKDILGDKKQEYFYAVYLDNQKKIITDQRLFIGTINYSVVHPREIFKEAYKLSASFIICIHNHPSGNVMPSKEDITITENLVKIGDLLNVKVIDHIIISKTNYYSFFENNNI